MLFEPPSRPRRLIHEFNAQLGALTPEPRTSRSLQPAAGIDSGDGGVLLADGRYGVMVAVKTSSFNDGASEARRSVHTGWTTPPIAAIPS